MSGSQRTRFSSPFKVGCALADCYIFTFSKADIYDLITVNYKQLHVDSGFQLM